MRISPLLLPLFLPLFCLVHAAVPLGKLNLTTLHADGITATSTTSPSLSLPILATPTAAALGAPCSPDGRTVFLRAARSLAICRGGQWTRQGGKCGNGVVEAALGEQCDDGARGDGDGCSAGCLLEEGHFVVAGDVRQAHADLRIGLAVLSSPTATTIDSIPVAGTAAAAALTAAADVHLVSAMAQHNGAPMVYLSGSGGASGSGLFDTTADGVTLVAAGRMDGDPPAGYANILVAGDAGLMTRAALVYDKSAGAFCMATGAAGTIGEHDTCLHVPARLGAFIAIGAVDKVKKTARISVVTNTETFLTVARGDWAVSTAWAPTTTDVTVGTAANVLRAIVFSEALDEAATCDLAAQLSEELCIFGGTTPHDLSGLRAWFDANYRERHATTANGLANPHTIGNRAVGASRSGAAMRVDPFPNPLPGGAVYAEADTSSGDALLISPAGDVFKSKDSNVLTGATEFTVCAAGRVGGVSETIIDLTCDTAAVGCGLRIAVGSGGEIVVSDNGGNMAPFSTTWFATNPAGNTYTFCLTATDNGASSTELTLVMSTVELSASQVETTTIGTDFSIADAGDLVWANGGAYLGELIITNESSSLSTIKSIETWLRRRWNVQPLGLPSASCSGNVCHAIEQRLGSPRFSDTVVSAEASCYDCAGVDGAGEAISTYQAMGSAGVTYEAGAVTRLVGGIMAFGFDTLNKLQANGQPVLKANDNEFTIIGAVYLPSADFSGSTVEFFSNSRSVLSCTGKVAFLRRATGAVELDTCSAVASAVSAADFIPDSSLDHWVVFGVRRTDDTVSFRALGHGLENAEDVATSSAVLPHETSFLGFTDSFLAEQHAWDYALTDADFESYMQQIASDTIVDVCGDGLITGNEDCDDGDQFSDSKCSHVCKFYPCGNGYVEPESAHTCDDGNTVDGDGCSHICQNEQIASGRAGTGIVHDLETVTGLTGLSDGSGNYVSGAGDLDGNGVDDVFVGIPGEPVFFLFLMDFGGDVLRTVEYAEDGAMGDFYPGISSEDENFPEGLAFLGDINGDGLLDLSFASRVADSLFLASLNADTFAMEDLVQFGPAHAIWGGTAVFTIHSTNGLGGDRNGDGIEDVLVGFTAASQADGHVLIFYPESDLSFQEPCFVIDKDVDTDIQVAVSVYAGRVSGIGDLDGDGVLDIAVADSHNDTPLPNVGVLYLYMLDAYPSETFKRRVTIHPPRTQNPEFDETYFLTFGWEPSVVEHRGDVVHLAVGLMGFDADNGAFYHLFLDQDGEIVESKLIDDAAIGVTLDPGNLLFGRGLATGDFTGDGVNDVLTTTRTNDLYVVPGLPVVCGDGIVDLAFEECDDGNLADGDGCSPACLFECGNGVIDGLGEECDDGNRVIGDGCGGRCKNEAPTSRQSGTGYAVDLSAVIGESLTNEVGMGLATYDMDGNGVDDIFTSGRATTGSLVLLLMEEGGTVGDYRHFEPTGLGGMITTVDLLFGYDITVLGDNNHDGLIDVVCLARTAAKFTIISLHPATLNVEKNFRLGGTSPLFGTPEPTDFYGVDALGIDRNGDGFGDMIVGGADHAIIVYPDADFGASAAPLRLDGHADITASTFFGASCASIGDLDGDGVVDVAVSAERDSTHGFNHGAIYIVLLEDFSVSDTIKGVFKIAVGLRGLQEKVTVDGTSLGLGMAFLGQANGITHIVASEYMANTGGDSNEGAFYHLFLDKNAVVVAESYVAEADLGGYDLATGQSFAFGLACGDVNGDGVQDVVAGSLVGDDLFIIPGVGSSCGDGVVDVMTEECDDGNGTDGDGCTGQCVKEFCGDGIVNNGGVETCDDGNTFNFDGCTSQCVSASAIDAVAGPAYQNAISVDVMSLFPGDTGNHLGCGLTPVGDVDKNGFVDIFAPNTGSSLAYLLLMGSGHSIVDSVRFDFADFGVSGYNPSSVAALGDLNDDNLLDFLFATDNDAAVFIVLSLVPLTYEVAISHLFPSTSPMFAGISDITGGKSTSALGADRDGDGREDIILCGWASSSNGFLSIFHPNAELDYDASVPLETVLDTHPDIVSGAKFANSCTGIGDVDGDGIVDVAAGSWNVNGGAANSGAFYIVTLNPYTDGTLAKSVTMFHQGLRGLASRAVFSDASFGWDLAFVEKVNGVTHILVGEHRDHGTNDDVGAYHHLFIDESLYVVDEVHVQPPNIGLTSLAFNSVVGLGLGSADFNNDGVRDVVTGGNTQPYIYIVPGVASDCGNGVREGTEQCDDGGNVDGDGCSSTCVAEYCGDGILNDIDELCDDGNSNNGDACTNSCCLSGGDCCRVNATPITHVRSSVRIGNDFRLGTVFAANAYAFAGQAALQSPGVNSHEDSFADIVVRDNAADNLRIIFLDAFAGAISSTTIAPSAASSANGERVGTSMDSLGDFDDNGVADFVTGNFDGNGGTGSISIVLLTNTGTVFDTHGIDSGDTAWTAGATLKLGSDVANLGDLNGDGTVDIAAGDDDQARVFILFLDSDMTLLAGMKVIENGTPNFGTVISGGDFGRGIGGVGDINGDGIEDMIIGQRLHDSGKGRAFVVFLESDGDVQSSAVIDSTEAGGNLAGLVANSFFGVAARGLGDLDGNGVPDLAIGAYGEGNGAVYYIYMQTDGTVAHMVKVGSDYQQTDFPVTTGGSAMFSLSVLGDLNNDCKPEVVVSSELEDGGAGAGYVLFSGTTTTKSSLISRGCIEVVTIGGFLQLPAGTVPPLLQATVEGWFYIPTGHNAQGALFSLGPLRGRLLSTNMMQIAAPRGGVRYDTAGGVDYINFSVTIPLDEWIHLAFVMSKTGDVTNAVDEFHVYLNGGQVSLGAVTSGAASSEYSSQVLGHHAAETGATGVYTASTIYRFDGKYGGYLRAWSTARSQSEIVANMEQQMVASDDLVLNLRFDDKRALATTVYNHAGTANGVFDAVNSGSMAFGTCSA